MLFDNTSFEGVRRTLATLDGGAELDALSQKDIANLEKAVDCWVFTDGMLFNLKY